METLAIILARGGSKGVPKKNIADLAGYPLIAYSVSPKTFIFNVKLFDPYRISTPKLV